MIKSNSTHVCTSLINHLITIKINTMKHLFLVMALVAMTTLHAQKNKFDEVADRIVNQSLEVQPGETVRIIGTPNELEALEALYVAVFKSGGIASLSISLPDAEVRIAKEVKTEYLRQPMWVDAFMQRLTDCVIIVESMDDADRWKNLDPEVLAAFRESSDFSRVVSRHRRVRVVTLGQIGGIPTEVAANLYQADYTEMKNNFWEAMSADHKMLQKKGKALLSQLAPGSKVHITSPHGTDITFRLADNAPMISCGKTTDQHNTRGSNYAWLPAGDAFTAINPGSANGQIIVPTYFIPGVKYTNLKIHFKKGLITSISADQSTAQLESRFLGKGADSAPLSSIDLGLNPYSKVLGHYRSFEMAGMITLGIGDNNWAGGDLDVGVNYNFHLDGSTLTVDNKKIISHGILGE
jgi:leucyl aminopeptidase (aminopeptidase T)